MLDQLVTTVTQSSKYRCIAPDLVRRIGAVELAKRPNLKTAVKATKNKLHQIGGAYFTRPIDYDRALAALSATNSPDALRAACTEVMALHASTQERLPILPDFYDTIFGALPPIRSVLDVACGLNPLARAWMPLPDDAVYHACDIYGDMINFLNAAFPLLGVNGRAEQRDIVGNPPQTPVDLALVLKTLPVLAQVEAAAVPRLLDTLRARHLLITFPVASLGGRGKGMVETYSRQFEGWVDGRSGNGRSWQVQRFEFATELAFLVKTA